MIIAYGKSDIGKAREMNQDAYYISDSSSEIKLYILADGMGGYKGGEIAPLTKAPDAIYVDSTGMTVEEEAEEIIRIIEEKR